MDQSPISIVIVTYGRLKLLERCIASIEAAVGSRHFEIVLIVNQDAQTLPDSKLEFVAKRKSLHVERVQPQHSGAARNKALPLVRGDWICFLDDDVELCPEYFKIAEETMAAYPNAEVIGGPDTTAKEASSFQRAVGLAYSSYFCTGATRRRHSTVGGVIPDVDETSLILCNLWIRTSVFASGAYRFPPELNRNEENVLLSELHSAGVKMVYQPALVVLHERKKSFKELWIPVFRSGFNRFRSFFFDSSIVSPAFFVPMLFVYYLIALLVHPHGWLALPLLMYLLLNLAFSLRAAIKAEQLLLTPTIMSVTFFVHVAYGLGSICGGLSEMLSRASTRVNSR
ncbi:MAG: glycosyltransferase [Bdellovibrionales bacterium]|nr:glycosyltransferase [Bdellovibrionales bacterium]